MQKTFRYLAIALVGLLSIMLLVACGDNTATSAPSAAGAAMSTTGSDAMMAKTTEAAMMSATTTDAMMAKTTSDAMMAKTTEAAMSGTPGAMMATTPGAMMAKTTEASMMAATPDAMMAKTTEAAMMAATPGAMMKAEALTGEFNNQGSQPVMGKVTLSESSDGKLMLHFQDLKAAGGQDLYVYLTKEASPSSDSQIKSGLEVGMLKAAQGNLDYNLAGSVDLSQYKSIALYSKASGMIFGYANLKSGPA
ncbi:MAG TPA: DM13 domain-containing protein [Chloroflexia bacterium]|nr:DM13 domain-containing protein [Chloroflexia bacterium]